MFKYWKRGKFMITDPKRVIQNEKEKSSYEQRKKVAEVPQRPMATLVSSQAYIYHCHLIKRALIQTKDPYSPRRLSRHNHIETHVLSPRTWTLTIRGRKHQPLSLNTVCFAADEPSPSSEIRYSVSLVLERSTDERLK